MNIIDFPGTTDRPIDPNKVTRAAAEADLDAVVVIGVRPGGELYIAASDTAGDAFLLLARGQKWLLENL